ncbi:uncharacterized protein V6R79_018703 [Siganus canaliculatus]
MQHVGCGFGQSCPDVCTAGGGRAELNHRSAAGHDDDDDDDERRISVNTRLRRICFGSISQIPRWGESGPHGVDSSASDECWLNAWKRTVALLERVPLILSLLPLP